MEVRDVMTEAVVTAPEAATVREVAELMRERNVGSVILLDAAGDPAGFITDRDLAVGVLAGGHEPSERIGDHASAPVIATSSSASVQQAAELMTGHGVRRLAVIDDDSLSGIVTLDDLAVRAGDLELAQRLTSDITRAALPGFFFHHRGG